jgi:hypothetical protein
MRRQKPVCPPGLLGVPPYTNRPADRFLEPLPAIRSKTSALNPHDRGFAIPTHNVMGGQLMWDFDDCDDDDMMDDFIVFLRAKR